MSLRARFRGLLAVLALATAIAACADGPTAAAPEAPAAEQGRILRPDQAAQLRPGDFIVIRPEQYAAYGIKQLRPDGIRAIPSGGGWDEACYLTAYGYDSCDPCYDDWGNYTCGGGICYDYNGGQIPCGQDPCYDAYYNYLCGTPTTPTPSTISVNYGSTATYNGQVNNGGILLKQIQLSSFSQSIANVASLSVSAAFKSVGAAGGGCGNTAGAFDFASASATGSGAYIDVSRVGQWLGTLKWQVDGTHSFTAVSGATGGGTFYTSDSYCG